VVVIVVGLKIALGAELFPVNQWHRFEVVN
jgi:hypothetical protein